MNLLSEHRKPHISIDLDPASTKVVVEGNEETHLHDNVQRRIICHAKLIRQVAKEQHP